MDFTGKITDISLDIYSRKPKITFVADDNETLEQIEELMACAKLSIEIKKWRNRRSTDANAYFHVLINKLARYYDMSDSEMKIKMNLEYGTVAYNLDGTKVGIKVPKGTNMEAFYPYCKWFGECEENGLVFDKFLLYKQTHELDTKEMSDLVNGVVSECQKVGIETKTEAEIVSLLNEWRK